MPAVRLEVVAALKAVIDLGLDVQTKYPYWAWEEAFVARWLLVPDFDSALARIYLAEHGLNRDNITCVQALRAWHCNQFKPVDMHLGFRLITLMEQDFDKVAPLLDEGKMDAETQEKVGRHYERFDLNNPAYRGRKIFDMGNGAQPK